MIVCPNCRKPLARTRTGAGIFWSCSECGGRAATLSVLRKSVKPDYLKRLWKQVLSGSGELKRRCPACHKLMPEVSVEHEGRPINLDVCKRCSLVWFDAREYEQSPRRAVRPKPERTPEAVQEAWAKLKINKQEEKARWSNTSPDEPDAAWKYVLAFFGVPVEMEDPGKSTLPWLTWSLVTLMVLIMAFTYSNLEEAVQEFGLIPAKLGRYWGMTIFTAFFLHGGVVHLLGNMYFLLVFGDNVEDYLGKGKYALLLLFAVIGASLAHVCLEPRSDVPCVGASGGISAIIVFYAMAFPHARLGFLWHIWLYFRWVCFPAYVALIL